MQPSLSAAISNFVLCTFCTYLLQLCALHSRFLAQLLKLCALRCPYQTPKVNQRKAAAESEGKTSALSAAMTRMQEDRNTLSQQLAAAMSRAKEAEAQAAQVGELSAIAWHSLRKCRLHELVRTEQDAWALSRAMRTSTLPALSATPLSSLTNFPSASYVSAAEEGRGSGRCREQGAADHLQPAAVASRENWWKIRIDTQGFAPLAGSAGLSCVIASQGIQMLFTCGPTCQPLMSGNNIMLLSCKNFHQTLYNVDLSPNHDSYLKCVAWLNQTAF